MITLWVDHHDTTESIKIKIQEKEGIPRDQQQLMFGEEQLRDGAILCDKKVPEGSTLYLHTIRKYSVNNGSHLYII